MRAKAMAFLGKISIRYLRSIKQVCHTFSLLCIDSLAGLSSLPNRIPGKKRVLIVRLDRIGDFVLWLDAARHLRTLYPTDTHEITLLGNDPWTSLAQDLGIFDAVWPLKRTRFTRNPVYRVKMLSRVRAARFDIVIQPTYSRELNFGDAVVRQSVAEAKVGFEGDFSNITPWQKRIGDRWYTRLIPATAIPVMELVRNAEFLRGLGLAEVKAAPPRLPFVQLPLEGVKEPYVVLFPGASQPIRQWPLERYISLAQRIHDKYAWSVVLCGGQEDALLGKAVEMACSFPVRNKIGETTLSQLASLIAGASLLIGNETSAIHIAAAVSTPSVCIAGGGHYGRFVPYRVEEGSTDRLPVVVVSKRDCFGCNWTCIYRVDEQESAPCIRDISADDVWKEMMSVVEKYQSRKR